MEPIQFIGIILFIPFMFFLSFFLSTKAKKLSKKSLEFKVIGYTLITSSILIELIIITIYFSDIIIVVIVLYTLGFIILGQSHNFTIRKIQEQEGIINAKNKDLVNVIETSSEISVSVANSVTELAASASEINATAEEIAGTTMDVTQGVQRQAQSLKEINSMAQNIKGIIKILTTLSEQTNLLALNASIEAGRAVKRDSDLPL